MTSRLVLHGTRASGHTHRVSSFLAILGLVHDFVDSPQAVRRTAAFLALNPLGQVPVLEDGPLVLADSNAILVYLARRYAAGSPWLTDDPVEAARVQRWFSIAAGELFQGPALARAGTLWGRGIDVARAREAGARLLAFLEGELAGRTWLAAAHPTLADLSLYPYVARAPEGRIDLAPFPAVRAWIDRVEALPGMTAMPHTPIPDGAA